MDLQELENNLNLRRHGRRRERLVLLCAILALALVGAAVWWLWRASGR